MRFTHWVFWGVVVLLFSGCAIREPAISPVERNLRAEIEGLRRDKEALGAERNVYRGEAERLSREAEGIRTKVEELNSLLARERRRADELKANVLILTKEVEALMAEVVEEAPVPEVQPIEFNRKVQLALRTAGFDPGPIDGIIGPRTRRAIKEFQKARGLKVDGIVGRETWGKLRKYLEMK